MNSNRSLESLKTAGQLFVTVLTLLAISVIFFIHMVTTEKEAEAIVSNPFFWIAIASIAGVVALGNYLREKFLF